MNNRNAFQDHLVRQSALDGGWHFAVALSRLTGMPMEIHHAAVLNTSPPLNEHLERGYVVGITVTDCDLRTYMAEGVYRKDEQQPAIMQRLGLLTKTDSRLNHIYRQNQLALGTRILSESSIVKHGLEPVLNEDVVSGWINHIKQNRSYLKKVPVDHTLPAVHDFIDKYAHHDCHFYTDALCRHSGGVAVLFSDNHHSFVLRADGLGEDIWGVRSISDMAVAYGRPGEMSFSADAYRKIMDVALNEDSDKYEQKVEEAAQVVRLRGVPALARRPSPWK